MGDQIRKHVRTQSSDQECRYDGEELFHSTTPTRAHECIDYVIVTPQQIDTVCTFSPHLFSWQFESQWCSSIDLVCRTTCSRTQSTAQCTPSTSTTSRRCVPPSLRHPVHFTLRACLVLRCRELISHIGQCVL